MGIHRFVVGPLSVLCILALVMGTASAAAIRVSDSTSNTDTQPVHHHLSPEAIIDSLEKKGANVTDVKAELQNGDTAAVKTWLETYLRAHEGEVPFRHHPGGSRPMANTDTSQ